MNNDVEIQIKIIMLFNDKDSKSNKRMKKNIIKLFSPESRIVFIFLFLRMLNQELNNSLTLVVMTIKPAIKKKKIEYSLEKLIENREKINTNKRRIPTETLKNLKNRLTYISSFCAFL